MSQIATPTPGAQVTRRSLDVLFAEAEQYGLVKVSQFRPLFGNSSRLVWHAWIEFQTISGTSLKAESQQTSTPHEALEQAIDKARQIAGQFK